MYENTVLQSIVITFLFFSSIYLTICETALSSLRNIHIRDTDKTTKSVIAKNQALKTCVQKPNEFLATILLLKTITIISLISMIVLLVERIYNINYINQINEYLYILVAFLLTVAIYFVFIEILPRSYTKNDIYFYALKVIVFVNTVRVLLKPFIAIFLNIVKFILKLFKKELKENILSITEEDIKTYVKEGTEIGVIEEGEEEMIHSIFEFSDTVVGEILTPRTAVFALDMNKKLSEVWSDIVEQGFSRIPIYNENIDNIEGILHTKDLLKYSKNKEILLKDIMKKAFYIPETKRLTQLLEDFKKKQTHMAIIIDEYGGTLGIITNEDLLEEIVGEIRDEFDHEEENIQMIKEKIYDIKGDVIIEELNQELDINIPISENYETVSGFIQYELGKVAEIGDQVKGDHYVLKVIEVENKRIEKIRVIVIKKQYEEINDGNSPKA